MEAAASRIRTQEPVEVSHLKTKAKLKLANFRRTTRLPTTTFIVGYGISPEQIIHLVARTFLGALRGFGKLCISKSTEC